MMKNKNCVPWKKLTILQKLGYMIIGIFVLIAIIFVFLIAFGNI